MAAVLLYGLKCQLICDPMHCQQPQHQPRPQPQPQPQPQPSVLSTAISRRPPADRSVMEGGTPVLFGWLVCVWPWPWPHPECVGKQPVFPGFSLSCVTPVGKSKKITDDVRGPRPSSLPIMERQRLYITVERQASPAQMMIVSRGNLVGMGGHLKGFR